MNTPDLSVHKTYIIITETGSDKPLTRHLTLPLSLEIPPSQRAHPAQHRHYVHKSHTRNDLWVWQKIW